eukprot:CAMPEP_0116545666 /NCGR_PEP_ID=MMETSP0397-20121206/2797_1 /TAXON_ID=216820 /ORGANISM="Cyclophora tenuis, Strain ECT3854" /LENGTH=205 /DNA_ID=CAMNT_0004070009 /DNA_START=43 /DNA_END=663 /DNA_ORIENTATION=-
MSDAPSWLQEGNNAGAVPAPAASTPSPAAFDMSGSPSPREASAPAANVADETDLPSMILIMRLANMGVAAAVMTCSIILMISLPTLSNWVLAVYATCGGLLICCLETQLKFLRVMIAVNFGFLFNSVARFLFYLLLGSVTWAYGNFFGQVVTCCLGAVAVFNTYVLCRYPSYRQMRERIAEEEDKRIEARISKEVKRQAIKSFSA